MCVILIKDKAMNSKEFDENELFSHFNNGNNDGAGILCIDSKGSIHIKKWPKTNDFNSIWKEIDNFQKDPSIGKMFVHFRLGTGGGTSIEQSHPHEIFKEKMYLLHNGKFVNYPPFSGCSDTQQVANIIEKELASINVDSISAMNSHIINLFWDKFKFKTSDNRMVLIDSENYLIFNPINAPRYGYWYDDGIWRCGQLDQSSIKAKINYQNKYNFIENNK